MNIVILIGYNRPEYLSVCCDQILKADNHNNYGYMFALDSGFDYDNLEVIDDFNSQIESNVFVSKTKKHPENNPHAKQSFHVLETYRKALHYTDELVFMIEDDIMIGKDFFTMHEAIHEAEKDICVSIASVNHRNHITGNNNQYYVSQNDSDYQSWGVCFKKKPLEEIILPYCNKEYYTSFNRYVYKTFPDSVVEHTFTEQDGLIRRIKEKHGLKAAFMCIPRCFHSGYYGYHRNGTPTGDLWTKKKAIESVIFDFDKLREKQVYDDSFVCDLNTEHDKIERI
jgi:hypothetical protein